MSTSRRGSITAARPVDRSPTRYDRWARPSVRTVSKITASEGCDMGVSASAKECKFASASPPKPAPTALRKNLRRDNTVLSPSSSSRGGDTGAERDPGCYPCRGLYFLIRPPPRPRHRPGDLLAGGGGEEAARRRAPPHSAAPARAGSVALG